MPLASELAVTTGASAMTLANTIFGSGVVVNSATITGVSTAYGTFTGANATLGTIAPSDTGIILSTGTATDFTNSDGSTNTNSAAGTSTGHGGAGDSDLDAVSGQTTEDAVVFEANFTPTGDFITMQFVFSSEEYLEYVSSGVNDAFGVWINGAYVPFSPAPNDIVSIDSVNTTSASNLYIDNPAGTDPYNTEMDGLTHVLSLKAPVNDGVANTIKIAIADGGDDQYDSNVLIAANSLQTVALAFDDKITLGPNASVVADVLANDIDDTGGGLTITEINGTAISTGQTVVLPSGESVTLNPSGTLTIASGSNLGSEIFTYTVEDSVGNTDIGYATINTTNYIVEGTAGNDSIGATYEDDPQGDLIDSNDHSDGSNADNIQAGDGNDTVEGGAGADTIDGGSGDDQLTGGSSNDLFVYNGGNDTITDFNSGNTGTLNDGDATNNDSIDLTSFYDNIYELHADQADDGVLNQSNTLDTKGNTADYSDNAAFGSGSLTFAGASPNKSSFSNENTGVICFTEGTLITTPFGVCPIERISPGEFVTTLDRGPQKVLWVAQTPLSESCLRQNEKIRPILLAPKLTGGTAPLLVSPQHCVLFQDFGIGECLIKATHLARLKGGSARIAHGKKHVVYHHILLEHHEIIQANGVWSESFYPGENALNALGEEERKQLLESVPRLKTNPVDLAYGERIRKVARFHQLPQHCNILAPFALTPSRFDAA